MSPPTDPLDVAIQLARRFDGAGIDYAVGGALAYALYGVPRATKDVDINVFVPDDRLPAVLDVLDGMGATFERQEAVNKARSDGMFIAWMGTVRLDVFTPSIPFS